MQAGHSPRNGGVTDTDISTSLSNAIAETRLPRQSKHPTTRTETVARPMRKRVCMNSSRLCELPHWDTFTLTDHSNAGRQSPDSMKPAQKKGCACFRGP